MTTRVEPPSGLRHSAKRTMSGITALTPGVASAWWRSRGVSSMPPSSKLLAPNTVIHRSALARIDVGGDHVAGAEVETELHGDEHDGKQNADQRDRKTDAVVKQISEGKRQDH